MTDRELLEFAAKAAGINVVRSRLNDPLSRDFLVNASARNPCQVSGPWNPITDDGDAMRLAVALGLVVDCSRPSAGEPFKQHAIWLDDVMSNAELTRRAIVRAAAEIGRQMP